MTHFQVVLLIPLAILITKLSYFTSTYITPKLTIFMFYNSSKSVSKTPKSKHPDQILAYAIKTPIHQFTKISHKRFSNLCIQYQNP